MGLGIRGHLAMSTAKGEFASGAAVGRRENGRQVVDTSIVLVDLAFQKAALLIDLAADGMAVQCIARPAIGTATSWSFLLPNSAAEVHGTGTVEWADDSGYCGIRFDGCDEGTRQKILAWLRQEGATVAPVPEADLVPALDLTSDLSAIVNVLGLPTDQDPVPPIAEEIERRHLTGAESAELASRADDTRPPQAGTGKAPEQGSKGSQASKGQRTAAPIARAAWNAAAQSPPASVVPSAPHGYAVQWAGTAETSGSERYRAAFVAAVSLVLVLLAALVWVVRVSRQQPSTPSAGLVLTREDSTPAVGARGQDEKAKPEAQDRERFTNQAERPPDFVPPRPQRTGRTVATLPPIPIRVNREPTRAPEAPVAPLPVLPTDNNQTLTSILSLPPTLPAVESAAAISTGLTGGTIKHKLVPAYPQAARALHLEGTVLLAVTVDASGNVAQVKAASGNPILVAAAEAAVKQWKYEPFQLNGHPIQKDTTVVVKFAAP